MNQPIGTLQGKPETDRAPFLRTTWDNHRDSHIVARFLALWGDNLLRQRCGGLKGTQTDGVIECRPLEIIPSTVGCDDSVMQMGHSIKYIRIMGCQPFCDLFQFGEVIAEEIALTERCQTLSQRERPQPRLLDNRLSLIPLHDNGDSPHKNDLQGDDDEDKLSPQTGANNREDV